MNDRIQYIIDHKTKPLGALGQLEELARQIASLQQTETPRLNSPHILVLAADHGIAAEGVSAYPPEVTGQMVLNFLGGGAAINVFARQHGIRLLVVDAGVNYKFPASATGLVSAKVARGSQNFRHQPALTPDQLQECRQHATQLVNPVIESTGCNIMGFGEMGIGNTSSAALLMHYLTGQPLANCVGRGTGLTDAQLAHKLSVLQAAANFHHLHNSQPELLLQTFGGLEIAQMTYAMLRAAEHGCLLLIDGFIASAAYLVALAIEPSLAKHAIFCHLSGEQGHRLMLTHLNAKPLLQLGLRLGEGTGCALAYPLVQSAVNFFNEMASFKSAAVSNKSV